MAKTTNKSKAKASKIPAKQKIIGKKVQKKVKQKTTQAVIPQNQLKNSKRSLRSSKSQAQQQVIINQKKQIKQDKPLTLKQSKNSTMKGSIKPLKASKKQQKKDQTIKQKKQNDPKLAQDKQKQQQEANPAKLMKKFRTKSIIQQLQKFKCQQNLGKYKITLHSTYEIDDSHKLYKHIQSLFALYVKKQKSKSQKMFEKSHYTFYPTFQFLLNGQEPSQSKCSICQFQFQNIDSTQLEKQLMDTSQSDIVALRCGHLLHMECLKMLVGKNQWFKCPICSTIYGKMIGDQPPGDMNCTVHNDIHCDGYQSVGTIIIHYSMRSGKRGDISYSGTGRTAYLPNNIQGNQVLSLLKQAFDRKLIFTIGRSVTTGRDNQVVWNGIHHKTNLSGGSAYFGYPDPTYFTRVKEELAAKGIF